MKWIGWTGFGDFFGGSWLEFLVVRAGFGFILWLFSRLFG